jgi:hypothetical protein
VNIRSSFVAGATSVSRFGSFAAAVLLALASPLASADHGNQRSAQSDCAREVARRGYTVLSTGNFEQTRDGWQLDVRARNHRGRITYGSCFVESRTGDVSLYGFGWGGGDTVDRFEFNCASKDEKYRECQMPIDGRARLVKRKSDAPCVEGRSWGQRRDRVWVDHGCRAQFEVVRGGGGGSADSIECRSQNERYRECPIRSGYEARITRDYTGRCRKDSTWGNRPGVVWVTSGCQGRFDLVRKGGGWSGGSGDDRSDQGDDSRGPGGGSGGSGPVNPGQQQRAEVHCRNEASRQGIEVRSVASARSYGSYWATTVDGTLRGQKVVAACRFYPASNRAELRY